MITNFDIGMLKQASGFDAAIRRPVAAGWNGTIHGATENTPAFDKYRLWGHNIYDRIGAYGKELAHDLNPVRIAGNVKQNVKNNAAFRADEYKPGMVRAQNMLAIPVGIGMAAGAGYGVYKAAPYIGKGLNLLRKFLVK